MLKYVRKAWDWLKHDFIGKVLFSFALLVIFWSKWSATRYLIDYYCGNKYIPGFLESLYSLSPRLDNKGVFVECTFKLLWTFVIINFLRAAFGDPGFMDKMNLVMPKNVLPDKLEKTCVKCDNIWKPPRAHHCKTCNKCILRMDHHCEWIANCVGAKNQKFFILFLLYGVTYSLFVIALSIMGLMLWLIEYPLNKKTQAPFTDVWGSVNRIMLGIGAVFFLLFTFDFLWEQMEGVLKNQSVVESHKNMHGRPRKFMPSMDKVFGINRWAWLLPVAPKLRVNTLEMLYYEIDVNSQDKPKDEKDKFKEDEFEKLPIYEKYFMK